LTPHLWQYSVGARRPQRLDGVRDLLAADEDGGGDCGVAGRFADVSGPVDALRARGITARTD
jgi:hypothetical protein